MEQASDISPPLPTLNLVLIGAGNVGHHLGQRLADLGLTIVQVYSRQKQKAKALAKRLAANPIDDLAEVHPAADLYILAVSDDAIQLVAEQLAAVLHPKALVVHTSGASPAQILAPYFLRYGLFYPLQTFTRTHEPDFSTIPFCVQAAKDADLKLLQQLGQHCGASAFPITVQQQLALHTSAVFVNNFVNHLYNIGDQLMGEAGLSFSLLQPLILETARKIVDHPPATVQTGPARRGDQQTIQRHLAHLEAHADYQTLYKSLTALIAQQTPPL